MSYTKGNWEVNKRASRNVKCNDITIANCSSGQDGVREDEEIANAKLIAAAPDLFEALQSCIDWVEEYGMDYILYEKAKAAISKAVGL